MVKGWGELRSLAPFSWDTRVDDHPPGEAAMRDFSDAYAYTRSTERPRRSTGQYAQTPSTGTKRRAHSATKEGDVGSNKRVARAGQDKENKQTPSTAYKSSRLGPASPAFQTPARSGQKSAQLVSKSARASRDANIHGTPSVGTALTHVTPSAAGGEQPTPSSEADPAADRGVQSACAEAAGPCSQALAHGGQVLENAEVPAEPVQPVSGAMPAAAAQAAQTTEGRPFLSQQPPCPEQACEAAAAIGTEPQHMAPASTVTAPLLDGAKHVAGSTDHVRHMAPAGPTEEEASKDALAPAYDVVDTSMEDQEALHQAEPTQLSAPAVSISTQQMHSPQTAAPAAAAAAASGGADDRPALASANAMPCNAQASGHENAIADPSVLQQAPVTSMVPDGSELAAAQTAAMPTAQEVAIASSPSAPSAVAPEPEPRCSEPQREPKAVPAEADSNAGATEPHSSLQAVSGDHAQYNEDAATQTAAQAVHSAAPGQEAKPAASLRRPSHQIISRSGRKAAVSSPTEGTRMALRSRTQGPDQKRRKTGGGRADRSRRAQASAHAGAYATRSQGGAATDFQLPDHSRGAEAGRTRCSRRQQLSKATGRATSSDLAAAAALAELRHENDADSDEASDMVCDSQCDDSPGRGQGSYEGVFRLTEPPLPLWITGGDLNQTSTGRRATAANTCPPLFQAPASVMASPERSAGGTPAVEVQPHHRQSAAAAAEAMLRNGSPLSGLHKLALSICARKKGSPGAALPLNQGAPVLAKDKENVSPPAKGQQAKAAGLSMVAGKRNKSAAKRSSETADMVVGQAKAQLNWDAYVADQLSSGKDAARQAKLVSMLEAQLARPGLGLLARACLLLRVEDARAGLLYSQYRGVMKACIAQHSR